MHVRTLITRRMGRARSLLRTRSPSLAAALPLSFARATSRSLLLASRKPRIEFIKNTTGSLRDDRDEEKVNATNAKLSRVCDAE